MLAAMSGVWQAQLPPMTCIQNGIRKWWGDPGAVVRYSQEAQPSAFGLLTVTVGLTAATTTQCMRPTQGDLFSHSIGWLQNCEGGPAKHLHV